MIRLRSLAPLVVFATLWSCTNPAERLPSLDHVPDFTATDASGHQFAGREMNGAVWVVDFIYTTCPAECPRMSAQLRKIEREFQDDNDVRFLSISVDPARDDPPALKSFADRWGASAPQWRFVTTTPQTVHLLAFSTFHLGDLLSVMEHSTKFALVDKKRTIRGYYSAFDPESMKQLRRDIDGLKRLNP